MDIRVIKTKKKFLVSIISESSVLGVFEKSSQMRHQVIGDRFKIQMHKLHLVGRLNLCPSKPIATTYLLVNQAFLKVQGQEELFTQTNSNHILSMGCCVRSDKVNRALKFIAETFRDSC